jgi:hypothetical protein
MQENFIHIHNILKDNYFSKINFILNKSHIYWRKHNILNSTLLDKILLHDEKLENLNDEN